MEKCLLVITATQSVMLVVAIICVAVTYSKSRNVEKMLKFSSKNANLSYIESSFSVQEVETHTKLLKVVRDMNAVVTNVSQQINHLNNSHEVLASKVSLLRDDLFHYQNDINRIILNITNAIDS